MIRYITPDIITRNILLIKAKITDIIFIKFEFVCQLCKGGTLLSSARCINNCSNPRPLMKIFMRVSVKDEQSGEAYVSLSEETACRAFGINVSSIDTFKTYFFLHGVFYYKAASSKTNPEYIAVIDFFKGSNSQRLLTFFAIPFCKIGYDDMTSATENKAKLVG